MSAGLNDPVRITGTEHDGKTGVVVSVFRRPGLKGLRCLVAARRRCAAARARRSAAGRRAAAMSAPAVEVGRWYSVPGAGRSRLRVLCLQVRAEVARVRGPRELYRAQGFPEWYAIEQGTDEHGEPVAFPKYAQVRMCGNAVCPPLAAALVRANFVHETAFMERAAA